jgi:hypothetical protein
LADEIGHARTRLTEARADAKTIPARVPISWLRPGSRRLDPVHKRVCDDRRRHPLR